MIFEPVGKVSVVTASARARKLELFRVWSSGTCDKIEYNYDLSDDDWIDPPKHFSTSDLLMNAISVNPLATKSVGFSISDWLSSASCSPPRHSNVRAMVSPSCSISPYTTHITPLLFGSFALSITAPWLYSSTFTARAIYIIWLGWSYFRTGLASSAILIVFWYKISFRLDPKISINSFRCKVKTSTGPWALMVAVRGH